MSAVILVRYGEIALKGKNRSYFEKALFNNLKSALRGLEAKATRKHGRFLVSGPAAEKEKIVERVSKVFGVVSVSSVQVTPLELETIKEGALELVEKQYRHGNSFKV